MVMAALVMVVVSVTDSVAVVVTVGGLVLGSFAESALVGDGVGASFVGAAALEVGMSLVRSVTALGVGIF